MVNEFKKCGIKVNPPTFVIVYQVQENLRKKVMPLRSFKPTSDVDFIAKDLRKRHNLNGVPLVKIKKMLRILQELFLGTDKLEALVKIEKEFELKVNEDLNKLPIQEIEQQKEIMNSLFLKNQIKKDDNEFVYDKRLDFDGSKEQSNWDLDTDENFWNLN